MNKEIHCFGHFFHGIDVGIAFVLHFVHFAESSFSQDL